MSSLKRWTAVRVSLDTRKQLDELRELWQAQAELQDGLGTDQTRSGKESTRDEIGYDQVIRRLILLVKRHRERGKKAATVKKAKNQRKEAE